MDNRYDRIMQATRGIDIAKIEKICNAYRQNRLRILPPSQWKVGDDAFYIKNIVQRRVISGKITAVYSTGHTGEEHYFLANDKSCGITFFEGDLTIRKTLKEAYDYCKEMNPTRMC
jgi:hypothetical protein